VTLPPLPDDAAPSSFRITILMLRRPEFLTYLAAAIGTLTGLWLLETTLQWTVLASSGSSALVGVLYVAIFTPMVVLIVPVGLVIDRYGAKPLLLASQAVWCSIMLGGATLNHLGWMNAHVAIALGVLDGTCTAMWTVPAQVVLGRVVRKELMPSAVGLGLLQFAVGRIIGGSLAGATLSAGPTIALLLGAISAALGLAAALRVRENRSYERRSMSPPWPAEIGQALTWAVRNPPAVSLLALGGITALFTLDYVTLLPAVSRTILHSGPSGLGQMAAAGGVGLALAAFTADPFGRFLGRGSTICLALGSAAVAMALLGASTILALSLVLVALVAGCLGVFGANNNSLLQALSPAAMRGRVLALYGLVVWVLFPAAAVASGSLADSWGARFVLQGMAALTLGGLVLLLVAYRPLAKLDIGRSGLVQLRTPS
jgi:MFS family permease